MSQQPSPNFFHHFASLEDQRVERTKDHALLDIVFIAVCAVISGANDFVAMATFGQSKRAWLDQYLDLPNGIPSHDTFNRVLSALDPQAFLQCFLNWIQTLTTATGTPLVHVDGKTLRASLDRAKARHPLHVVSAWAGVNRLVLGQVAVDEKSNEITAIPKLLEMLELHGAIVTMDAMGCQKAIAAKIRERGADYVLTVKGNQEHLEEDVIEAFTQRDERSARLPKAAACEEEETGHGRQEYRRYEALPVPTELRDAEAWKDLRSICRVSRTYTEGGESKSDVRYFISSLPPQAKKLAAAIRGHWGIENGLHWVLDMYFGEDRSRARSANAAENLALLRRWVLSLLRNDKAMTGSIEKKRLQAGWKETNLEKLLGLV